MSKKRLKSKEHSEFISQFSACELCGVKRPLELHHIIPICAGGSDTPGNWIAICNVCHYKLTPRSELTKMGLKQAKNNGIVLGQKTGNKLNVRKALTAKDVILHRYEKFGGDLNGNDVIALAGISKPTFYKYVKELSMSDT